MVQERIPKQKKETDLGGWPTWWNNHGFYMEASRLDTKKHSLLLIGGETASLRISPNDDGDWYLEWKIKHSPNSEIKGRIEMDTFGINSAFGISETKGRWGGDKLAERFGADSAEYGHYIRKGEYLNIPGPGVGFIGDPNLSIHLDAEIKSAIRALLVTRS